MQSRTNEDATNLTVVQSTRGQHGTANEGNMKNKSWTSIMIVTAFFMGFGLGGLSLHYAVAQGIFGLSTSVSQLGSALVDMQKNVDDLQKNMGTVKQVKEQLSSLSPQGGDTPGGDLLKKDGDSLKDMKPNFWMT
jgi:hypothetical protein